MCCQRVFSHQGQFSVKMDLAPPLSLRSIKNSVPGVYPKKKEKKRKELAINGIVDSLSFFLGQYSIFTVNIEDTFQCVRCPSVRTLLGSSTGSGWEVVRLLWPGGGWFYAVGVWRVMVGARPAHSQGARGCGPGLLITRFRFLSRRT